MLKYLVIPLANDSVSFCHYNSGQTSTFISADILRKAVFWAMKSNLTLQFIYPKHPIPAYLTELMNSVRHAAIIPCNANDSKLLAQADIVVFEDWSSLNEYEFVKGQSYVVRTSLADLLKNKGRLKNILHKADRLNIVLLDIPNINETGLKDYGDLLHELIPSIISEYICGHQVQINILTDRLVLMNMNNCNAGYEAITLAPNGNFYICPAFYFENMGNIGDLQTGLELKNAQLYRLNHAPICRICDAWQCKRCIWLNKKMTREVNTPSHEQCTVAHVERNASRDLLAAFREKYSDFLPETVISEIDYIDPFIHIINKTY